MHPMHCKDAVYVVVKTAEQGVHLMLIKQPFGIPRVGGHQFVTFRLQSGQ